jgi:alpha-D-ribose 1-methylphosphonate 5-triphosphate synthase subunit PhnG
MTDMTTRNPRQERLSALASASGAKLLELWARLGIDPACEMVRGPETGLVALRGRIGGGGAPFNFGEATVTRATVRLENGAVGHSVALGRDRRKAKLIAILDALAQDPEMETKIDAEIVGR